MELLNESVSMDKVPHIDTMSYTQIKRLFSSNNWNVTQKMDGFNVSFGLIDNNIFIKPKTGKPFTSYKELEILSNRLSYFEPFKRFYKALEESDFKQEYLKLSEDSNIIFFGELISNTRQNVILYDKEYICNGAIVLFGVKEEDNEIAKDITSNTKGKLLLSNLCKAMTKSESMYWKFYLAKPIELRINIRDIQEYIQKNNHILDNKKRDDKSKLNKKLKMNELQKLIINLKKSFLVVLSNEDPFLGAERLEGAIIRNIDNGALCKVVDREYFTSMNKAVWYGRLNATNLTKNFINEIMVKILKNTDIIWESKLIDLINQYLFKNDKFRFASESEIYSVLNKEFLNENPKEEDIDNKFISIARKYYNDMKSLKEEIKAMQNSEYSIDIENYKRTNEFIVNEVRELNKLVSKDKDNIYGKCIWFCLSEKTKASIRNKYL